jgi:Pyruvate/2-oxoacid:ferredoxin oxidoreductase delta subunit
MRCAVPWSRESALYRCSSAKAAGPVNSGFNPYCDTGYPQPTEEFETLEADSLVLALGQDVDLSLLDGVPGLEVVDGVVKVEPNMMTGHAGIFAGGDMVPSERTVTVGVGHGKKAARNIDAWLRGTPRVEAARHEPASFDKLNAWYYSDAPKTVLPTLDLIRRQSTFDEVVGGLDEANALFEARRCLSCGNCFECDNCYGVCPDNAVIKLGPGKRFECNYDYCKGCGLCVAECPCRAIKVVPRISERASKRDLPAFLHTELCSECKAGATPD